MRDLHGRRLALYRTARQDLDQAGASPAASPRIHWMPEMPARSILSAHKVLRQTSSLNHAPRRPVSTRPVIEPSLAAIWMSPSRRPRLTQKKGTLYRNGCSGLPRKRRAMFSAAHAPAGIALLQPI